MICLEVQINGERICRAGVGEFGVLASSITWVNNRRERSVEDGGERVSLNVGGFAVRENDSGEFVTWVTEKAESWRSGEHDNS